MSNVDLSRCTYMHDKFFILRITIQFVLDSVQAVAPHAHPTMLLASV